MLAVTRGLENWRYLLENAKFQFEVWTNHKNSEYFMKMQKLNQQQARQTLYLFRFDFILKHILGTKIGKADKPSRRPDWKVEVENNNKNKKLIKEWINSLVEVVVDILEKIKKIREKDKEVVRIVEKIKKVGIKALREDK